MSKRTAETFVKDGHEVTTSLPAEKTRLKASGFTPKASTKKPAPKPAQKTD